MYGKFGGGGPGCLKMVYMPPVAAILIGNMIISMDLGVSYFQANPYVYNSIGVFIDALKVCSRCFLVGGSGFNWYCIVSPLL